MTGSEISRRRFLSSLGLGAAALGGVPLLSACGGGSSGLSGDQGGASSSPGAKPTISQWYHQYGEAGTQQAAKLRQGLHRRERRGAVDAG